MADTPAFIAPPARRHDDPQSRLIERANRLYHEWTAGRFDADHRARHRVEAPFWQWVGRTLLCSGCEPASTSNCTILDVGCGGGFVIEQLIRWTRTGDRLIGLDLSVASLSSAARKVSSRCDGKVEWLAGSGTQLPLAGESVDLVTINASMHHFASPASLLREIDRVLTSRGHLAIGFEPNARHFDSAALRRLGESIDRLAWYLSPRQNRRRLRQKLARPADACPLDVARAGDKLVAARIAQRLIHERLSVEELQPDVVLDLIDPHARKRQDGTGLRFDHLLAESLPHYSIVRLSTSDYLGASMRRVPSLRAVVDMLGRSFNPMCGSLLSCVLQKGEACE